MESQSYCVSMSLKLKFRAGCETRKHRERSEPSSKFVSLSLCRPGSRLEGSCWAWGLVFRFALQTINQNLEPPIPNPCMT